MNFNRKKVIIRDMVMVPAITGVPLGDSDVATKVPQFRVP
ncbi:unnamed protein product [marine sediment metagenome]|uniref:Uncharacterized protein n=1 Tax=marine sediment metagenome TaxID=412755 RepID=X1HYF6_9ZZZZ